jgi:hypothetical protein
VTAEERELVEQALYQLRSMEGSRVTAIGILEYLLDPDPERFWPTDWQRDLWAETGGPC